MKACWPVGLFNLLAYIISMVGETCCRRDLSVVEFFSGVAVIQRTFIANNFAGRGFDICTHAKHENLNCSEGLLSALLLATRITRHGLAHWATVCSTWIFMSRSSVKRSADNVWGNLDSKAVMEANCQVSCMCMILVLLDCLGIEWILEQPMTSLMDKVPLFSLLPRAGQLRRTSTWMGAFGAPTRKATWLLSSTPFARNLQRQLPRGSVAGVEGSTTLSTAGADGRTAVTGGPHLKQTQAYPVGYGEAVFQEWAAFKAAQPEADGEGSESSVSDTDYQGQLFEQGEPESACADFGVITTTWMC